MTPSRVATPSSEPVVRSYNFHGLAVTISGDAAPFSALHRRLSAFVAHASDHADIQFEFQSFNSGSSPSVSRPAGPMRPVYDPEQGEVLYSDDEDALYLEYAGRVRAVCDPELGSTRVSVSRPEPADEWLLSHPIMTLPLLEILKRRGLYSVHAAGFAEHGRGLLMAGGSGAGKTTLSISLARAGFGFLGDDMLFLSTRGGRLRVHAFPDEVDITDATARLFPELRSLLDEPRQHGWPKRSFRAEAMYGVNPIWTCAPAAVVFPSIAHTATSTLEPMPPDEALLELAPNVLLTEPRACREHLAALARLTAETPCYRLWTGRDFEALPALLAGLLR